MKRDDAINMDILLLSSLRYINAHAIYDYIAHIFSFDYKIIHMYEYL